MAIHDEILGNIEYEYEDYLPTGTVTEYYKYTSSGEGGAMLNFLSSITRGIV